jgi:hypothetical protein
MWCRSILLSLVKIMYALLSTRCLIGRILSKATNISKPINRWVKSCSKLNKQSLLDTINCAIEIFFLLFVLLIETKRESFISPTRVLKKKVVLAVYYRNLSMSSGILLTGISTSPASIASPRSLGFWPSTVQPTEKAVPRISLTVPLSSRARDL